MVIYLLLVFILGFYFGRKKMTCIKTFYNSEYLKCYTHTILSVILLICKIVFKKHIEAIVNPFNCRVHLLNECVYLDIDFMRKMHVYKYQIATLGTIRYIFFYIKEYIKNKRDNFFERQAREYSSYLDLDTYSITVELLEFLRYKK